MPFFIRIFLYARIIAKRLSYVFLLFAIFTVFSTAKSFATSCNKDFVSLERAFIDADVVFYGSLNIAKSSVEYVFDVKELYKAPEELEGQKTLSLISSGIGSPRFTKKIGYVLFGHISHSNNKEAIINVYPCDKNSIIPDEFPSFINSLENANEEERQFFSELIFVGEVGDSYQQLEKCDKIKPSCTVVNSAVGFKVVDILKQEDGRGNNLAINDEIVVRFSLCGQGYQLGEKYIVYANASGEKQKSLLNGKIVERMGYASQCYTWSPLLLNLKDRLRDFSKRKFD